MGSKCLNDYKLFKSLRFVVYIFLIGLGLSFLASCSDDDNNSSTTPPVLFEAPFSGSRRIEATAFQNTITLSWNVPEHTSLNAQDFLYRIYFSLQDNIQTIEDAETNGVLMDGLVQERDSFVIRGFQNSTRYYANIVIKNSSNNESIGFFSPYPSKRALDPH